MSIDVRQMAPHITLTAEAAMTAHDDLNSRNLWASPKDDRVSTSSLSEISTPFDAIPMGDGRKKIHRATLSYRKARSLGQRLVTAALAVGLFTASIFVPVNKSEATAPSDDNQPTTAIQQKQPDTALTADETKALEKALRAIRARVQNKVETVAPQAEIPADETSYHVSQEEQDKLDQRIQEIRQSVIAKTSVSEQVKTPPAIAIADLIVEDRTPDSAKEFLAKSAPSAKATQPIIVGNDKLCTKPFDLVQFLYPATTPAPEVTAPAAKIEAAKLVTLSGTGKRPVLHPIGKKIAARQLSHAPHNSVCKTPFEIADYLRLSPPTTNPDLEKEPANVVTLTDSKKTPVLNPTERKNAAKKHEKPAHVRVVFKVAKQTVTAPANTEQQIKPAPTGTTPQKNEQVQKAPPKTPKPVSKPNKDEVSGILASKFGLSQDVFASLDSASQTALTNATLSGSVGFIPYEQKIDPTVGTHDAVTLFNIADELAKNKETTDVAVKMYKQACDVACSSNYLMTHAASASVMNYAKLLKSIGRDTHAVYLSCVAVHADETNIEAIRLLGEAAKTNPDLVEKTYARVSRMNEFGLFGSLDKAAQTILDKTVQASQKKSGSEARPVTYDTHPKEPYKPLGKTAWNSVYHAKTNG